MNIVSKCRDSEYKITCMFNFFSIDLGFGEEGIKTLIDKDLLGLESVLMNLLLERGIVGVLFWCVIDRCNMLIEWNILRYCFSFGVCQ